MTHTEIPASEIRRQRTDDLRGIIERRADIAVHVIDRMVEIACQRKLSAREADAADEAVFALKHALDDLWSYRQTKPN
jgi:hypothetical protein